MRDAEKRIAELRAQNEAMREELEGLLLALYAKWKATVAFLENPKHGEYRAAMHDHKANRMRAESRALAVLLAKLREVKP